MRLNELITKLEEIRDYLEENGIDDADTTVTISVFEEYNDIGSIQLYKYSDGEVSIVIQDY